MTQIIVIQDDVMLFNDDGVNNDIALRVDYINENKTIDSTVIIDLVEFRTQSIVIEDMIMLRNIIAEDEVMLLIDEGIQMVLRSDDVSAALEATKETI